MSKYPVMIAGAGHVGMTIAYILAKESDYSVFLIDSQSPQRIPILEKYPKIEYQQINIEKNADLIRLIKKNDIQVIICCLPYFLNLRMAELASDCHCHYFSLTEDITIAQQIGDIGKNQKKAFVAQCGLAPGLINIIANDLMQEFQIIQEAKLRCGALPISTSHSLQYAFTWSVDGLINEYANLCEAIENHQLTHLTPLSDLENLQIDGLRYEAFNTSGGLGTLARSYQGKIATMNYKSIRYPGHCEKMRFLMQDMSLKDDRVALKKILEHNLPYTSEDVVIVYVSISGFQQKKLQTKTYLSKFYASVLDDVSYSAIQLTTAFSACAVIDTVLENPHEYEGELLQENFKFKTIIENRFGKQLEKLKHEFK